MSNWPDHTPEPGEEPGWMSWLAPATIVIGVALLLSGDLFNGQGPSWRLPPIAMPAFELPQVTLPDLPQPEETPPPATAQIAEHDIPFALDAAPAEPGAPSVQSVPFDDCVAMITNGAMPFGEPVIVEDTPDLRVARFKFLEGDLTLTCSRPNGTMTIDTR